MMKGPDGRSEKEKMLAGDLERTAGPELAANHRRTDGPMRA